MDKRITRLRLLSRQLDRLRARAQELEPERAALIRELAAERGRGKLAELAAYAGLSRARIHQIINGG